MEKLFNSGIPTQKYATTHVHACEKPSSFIKHLVYTNVFTNILTLCIQKTKKMTALALWRPELVARF